MTFTDTSRVIINAGTSDVGVTLTTADLLPSLNINSSQERQVVLEHVTLEVMPNNFADQQLYQLRSTIFDNASEPYRLASSINPTKFHLDFRRMARWAPGVMFPVPVSSSTNVLRIQAYSEAQNFEAVGRVTTRVTIFPQRSLLNPVVYNPSSADDTNQQNTSAVAAIDPPLEPLIERVDPTATAETSHLGSQST